MNSKIICSVLIVQVHKYYLNLLKKISITLPSYPIPPPPMWAIYNGSSPVQYKKKLCKKHLHLSSEFYFNVCQYIFTITSPCKKVHAVLKFEKKKPFYQSDRICDKFSKKWFELFWSGRIFKYNVSISKHFIFCSYISI